MVVPSMIFCNLAMFMFMNKYKFARVVVPLGIDAVVVLFFVASDVVSNNIGVPAYEVAFYSAVCILACVLMCVYCKVAFDESKAVRYIMSFILCGVMCAVCAYGLLQG